MQILRAHFWIALNHYFSEAVDSPVIHRNDIRPDFRSYTIFNQRKRDLIVTSKLWAVPRRRLSGSQCWNNSRVVIATIAAVNFCCARVLSNKLHIAYAWINLWSSATLCATGIIALPVPHCLWTCSGGNLLVQTG